MLTLVQIFNRILRIKQTWTDPDEFKVEILPVEKFTNGALYVHLPKWYVAHGAESIFVHANYIVGAFQKERSLRSKNLWKYEFDDE